MLDPGDPVVALKDDANAALRDGDVDLAVATCDEALAALETRAVRGSDRTHPGNKSASSASASPTDATRLTVSVSREAPSKNNYPPSEQKQKQKQSSRGKGGGGGALEPRQGEDPPGPPGLTLGGPDARSAADLQLHWPKAYHRLARIESRLKLRRRDRTRAARAPRPPSAPSA